MLALFLASPSLATTWKQPPQEVLDVLHAAELPRVWTASTGAHLLLADPIVYPPLAERAAPMHKLAGQRIDPVTGGLHAQSGSHNPRLLAVDSGETLSLDLPADLRLLDVRWSTSGERFALSVAHPDHIGLWVGTSKGKLEEVPGVRLNPVLSTDLYWTPDGRHLITKSHPQDRGEPPPAPVIPGGPMVLEGDGDAPRSTYEARNLLETAHDEQLFAHFGLSQIVLVDAARATSKPLGEPGLYSSVSSSPDGDWLLVERLTPPWSHETAWWRFAHQVEVWTAKGEPHQTLAVLPLADEVPIHGVPQGPRRVSWRATADASLFWVEALDGGDPAAEAAHRDRLLRLDAPFTAAPQEVFVAEHRVQTWRWGEAGDTLMLTQRDRERRWRHEWLLHVDAGTAKPWFDLSEKDRYASPGTPLMRRLDNGQAVLRQQGDAVYFSGSGSTDQGDRPFLDLRRLGSDQSERLFRASRTAYEGFITITDDGELIIRRESTTDVPNYHLITLGEEHAAEDGEATRSRSDRRITHFEDPTPQLRQIEKRIVRYEREDGVPLSFHLYLPPGYQEGTRVPTVLYAYPLEYSDAKTAGQVRGSEHVFTRIHGPSHLFFLLQGYAVLQRTAMPVIGDPETAYDTFIEQLVADAEAAVAKAVELGVADADRIGIIGHSHGGLMTATLLAHSDLFRAGIARSGAYNHTIRPFGFQSERRTLWEAFDTYTNLSPVMHAPKINEPLLLIHGAVDENPGTIPFQSERLFQSVRGSGGTSRLVMLPHEGHGYRARESVEHVLWEQLSWFDTHVKNTEPQQ